MTEDKTYGIALSGGGHRAAAFGLGVLLYLSEVGLNQHVRVITSVSGGSLLNAFLRQASLPFDRAPKEQFQADAATFARLIAGNPWWFRVTVRWAALGFILVTLVWWLGYLNDRSMLLCLAAWLGILACVTGPRCGGTLWGWRGTWLYCASVVWSIPACALLYAETSLGTSGSWMLSNQATTLWQYRLFLLLVSIALIAYALVIVAAIGYVIGQRHVIAGLAYGRTFLTRLDGTRDRWRSPIRLDEQSPIPVDEQSTRIRHVFCATELHAGHHAYFSHDVVYTRGFGIGAPGGLPLRAAVQASANFPGGFPPRPMQAARFGFHWLDTSVLREPRAPHRERYSAADLEVMRLTDGGVFDNLADSWHMEHAERRRRVLETLEEHDRMATDRWLSAKVADFGLRDQAEAMERFTDDLQRLQAKHETAREEVLSRLGTLPDRLIVVNGGTVVPWQPVTQLAIPVWKEIVGFVKTFNVAYNNTVTDRIRDLRARFKVRDPEGVVIDMNEDPAIPTFYGPDEAAKERWQNLWPAIGRPRRVPKLPSGLHRQSREVPTTLLPLGTTTTAHLMYHGYLQALASMYVQFDSPWPSKLPTIEYFLEFVRGGADILRAERRGSAFRRLLGRQRDIWTTFRIRGRQRGAR